MTPGHILYDQVEEGEAKGYTHLLGRKGNALEAFKTLASFSSSLLNLCQINNESILVITFCDYQQNEFIYHIHTQCLLQDEIILAACIPSTGLATDQATTVKAAEAAEEAEAVATATMREGVRERVATSLTAMTTATTTTLRAAMITTAIVVA
jgi:hypothetical protein